jgi:hypothetical protein
MPVSEERGRGNGTDLLEDDKEKDLEEISVGGFAARLRQ